MGDKSGGGGGMELKMDQKWLLRRVRKMNEAAAANNRDHSSSHHAGGGGVAMADIVEEMSRVKREYAEECEKRAAERRRSARREERVALCEGSGPYPHPSSWDGSNRRDPNVVKLMQAPEDCDMSGIRWADCNDIPRTKEERIDRDRRISKPPLPWYQPDSGKIFGESPITTCSESYQIQLCRELERTVQTIASETDAMPVGTVRLSNLKAGNERDLAYMLSRLERAQEGAAAIEKRRKERRRLEKMVT